MVFTVDLCALVISLSLSLCLTHTHTYTTRVLHGVVRAHWLCGASRLPAETAGSLSRARHVAAMAWLEAQRR